MDKLTGYLYARPSFIEGMSRLIDFGNTLQIYNSSSNPQQADYLALSSDWWVIGNDLNDAMIQYQDSCMEASEGLLRQAQEEIFTKME